MFDGLLDALSGAVRQLAANYGYSHRFGRPAAEWCSEAEHSPEPTRCQVRESTMRTVTTINLDTGGTGHIRVRPTLSHAARVRARVCGHAQTQGAASAIADRVIIVTSGDSIRVRGPRPAQAEGWSVDFELEVPRHVGLKLRTKIGSIELVAFEGAVVFETVNGGIHLERVSGEVRGATANGHVYVGLDGETWKGPSLDVTTTNGGIAVDVPDGYSAHFDAATLHGGLNVHFPVEAHHAHLGPQHIVATLGSGGAPIRLRTTNGNIHIRRAQGFGTGA